MGKLKKIHICYWAWVFAVFLFACEESGDNEQAGGAFVQSDIAGSWTFIDFSLFKATYDQNGKRIDDATVPCNRLPSLMNVKADGTVHGECVENVPGVSRNYAYSGKMSADKMQISGNMELRESWETGAVETTDYDWTGTRNSGK